MLKKKKRKKEKRGQGKVCAKTQAGWRRSNGALGGTTCTGTRCSQLVNHPSPGALKECLSRKGGKKPSVRLGGSHAHLASLSPSGDLGIFSCLSKKDKRYGSPGMKIWVTFKQRKAETAV